jgi:hypothetical protein
VFDSSTDTLNLLSGWWWLIFVLVGSFMFAAGNFIDELLIDTYEQPIGVLVIISGLFGFVVMILFGGIALTSGVSLMVDANIILQSILVGMFELLWVIPYLYAMERRGAVVIGPMFQLIPVVAFGLEAMTGVIPPLLQIFGALILIAGGVLLSLEAEEDEEGEHSFTIDWITVGLMLLSVGLVAAIYVLFKDVGLQVGYVTVGFWSGGGMLLMTVLIWIVWHPYRVQFRGFVQHADGRAVGIQLLNEVMDTGGAYLTHLANLIGPSVMVVTAFNAAQPLFILLIGAGLGATGWISKRTLSKKMWKIVSVGILLIAAGTVVVAFDYS